MWKEKRIQPFVAFHAAKRLLGRTRSRWKVNIKRIGKEVDWEAMEWIYPAQE
jgi:hypothetical protein